MEFEKWFQTVPEFKKKYFEQHSMDNVLDTHANELYETAHEYFNKIQSGNGNTLDGRKLFKRLLPWSRYPVCE